VGSINPKATKNNKQREDEGKEVEIEKGQSTEIPYDLCRGLPWKVTYRLGKGGLGGGKKPQAKLKVRRRGDPEDGKGTSGGHSCLTSRKGEMQRERGEEKRETLLNCVGVNHSQPKSNGTKTLHTKKVGKVHAEEIEPSRGRDGGQREIKNVAMDY